MFIPPEFVDCECDSCCEGNCSIDLTGRTNDVHILNLNCVRSRGKLSGPIADCVILYKQLGVFAIVELKGGQTKAIVKEVVGQIQGGLDAMTTFAWDQHIKDFFPILMYKGPDPTSAFASSRVKFRGQLRRIIFRPCGSPVSGIKGL